MSGEGERPETDQSLHSLLDRLRKLVHEADSASVSVLPAQHSASAIASVASAKYEQVVHALSSERSRVERQDLLIKQLRLEVQVLKDARRADHERRGGMGPGGAEIGEAGTIRGGSAKGGEAGSDTYGMG